MKLKPAKTNRGWELCDETGTFESLETSEIFASRKLAQAAADRENFAPRGFDELRAMESIIL